MKPNIREILRSHPRIIGDVIGSGYIGTGLSIVIKELGNHPPESLPEFFRQVFLPAWIIVSGIYGIRTMQKEYQKQEKFKEELNQNSSNPS